MRSGWPRQRSLEQVWVSADQACSELAREFLDRVPCVRLDHIRIGHVSPICESRRAPVNSTGVRHNGQKRLRAARYTIRHRIHVVPCQARHAHRLSFYFAGRGKLPALSPCYRRFGDRGVSAGSRFRTFRRMRQTARQVVPVKLRAVACRGEECRSSGPGHYVPDQAGERVRGRRLSADRTCY